MYKVICISILLKLLLNTFVVIGHMGVKLTVREEYGLRVFENKVLRKIFEPGGKTEE
jgi:hypothetical protein